jgi:ribosomal protein S18 acetylase RimI-like enzyme
MIKTIPPKATPRKRGGSRTARPTVKPASEPARLELEIRPVRRADMDAVIGIDATVTGIEKRDYWLSLYRRYGKTESTAQHFLVAVRASEVVGFIIGEVRDWEFGSPPCGWVFGIDVRPDARLGGTGTQLLNAICANFRRAGIRKVRTILARDNTLVLSFFRSQGMMTGPFIPLEMDIDV